MIRWISVGLIALFGLLVVAILGGTVLAQGPNPMMRNGWGSSGMMGGWHHGMMNGWVYTPGITNTVPNGNGYGGWGCNGCGGRMMGRSNAWGWSRNRGWGMQGLRGYYGQQPSNQGRYPPQPLPDDGNSPKTREDVSFEADIQPIFNTRCVACHGGTAGLYLNSYNNVMNGSVNGPVVIPRDPSNSHLIQHVQSGYMPLGGPPLSQARAQTLANWVAAGAPNN